MDPSEARSWFTQTPKGHTWQQLKRLSFYILLPGVFSDINKMCNIKLSSRSPRAGMQRTSNHNKFNERLEGLQGLVQFEDWERAEQRMSSSAWFVSVVVCLHWGPCALQYQPTYHQVLTDHIKTAKWLTKGALKNMWCCTRLWFQL